MKIDCISGKKKKLLKRKGQDSKRVKDFNVPEDPRKTSEVINTKWINVFSCLALLGAPSSHVFHSGLQWIPLRSAHFDDADSSWSLGSNYSCPVKHYTAPKDQFIAWGPFSYPLKTPISTPVKVGTHQPLNSNEHSPRQDQDNNENSILVDGEIHLYTSNYQLLAQPQTPQYPFRHIFPRQAPSFFLYSLVIKSLLMEGIQFSFQGRPSGPQ